MGQCIFQQRIINQSNNKTNMDKASYALGLNIGQQLKQMGLSGILNIEDFAASIKDTLDGNELKMPLSEAQQVLNAFFGELETKQRAAAA